MNPTFETGAAALVFALVFLVGGKVNPLRPLLRSRRAMLSFGAGMSAAYVFVHLMPELNAARGAFTNSVSIPLRYEGMGIYYLALVGFLVFYGLDVMHVRLRQAQAEAEGAGAAFKLQIGGFAAYVWLMGYLLVHNLEHSSISTGLYTLAIGFHFLELDHSLRSEHGAVYDRIGRQVLAGAAVLGWGTGLVLPLPQYALALLVAFISGAIIMNSTIMEMPTGKDGRFGAFMVGGLLYGALLLPLG